MPPVGRKRISHTNPSAVAQGGRVGHQRRNKHDEQWDSRFNEIVQYKVKHGDCDVPTRQGKLGAWVKLQRNTYMANSLAQDRIDRLNGIGFKWAMKQAAGPKVPWETRFNQLVQYKTNHGDCHVPSSQGKLGTWVRTQRIAYKANSLAQDRIDQLSGIDFKWAMGATKGGSGPIVPWETRFNELVQYKTKSGHCNVLTKCQGKLGEWVSTQRKAYKANSLAQDRIDRLSSIGFKWAMKQTTGPKVPWETRFNELVQYKANHGDCHVPSSQGKLGTWESHQRRVYKANSLAQDRIDRLNGIGFKWAIVATKGGTGPKVPWETRFNELVQYKAKQGDCNIPQSQGKLGIWVNTQRRVYKANSLAQDRIDQLNGIGFKWTFGKTKIGDCASGPLLSLPAPISNNPSHHNESVSNDEPIKYVI